MKRVVLPLELWGNVASFAPDWQSLCGLTTLTRLHRAYFHSNDLASVKTWEELQALLLVRLFQRGVAMMRAVHSGRVGVVERLLSLNLVHADACDSCALVMAANEGNVEMCELLLAAPQHPAQADADNSSALFLAAVNGHFAVCELLLAAPQHPAQADADDSKALVFAAGHGHIAVCELLLAAPQHPAHASARDNMAMALAAAHGHIAVCELLQAHH